jgi:hypothetical protein
LKEIITTIIHMRSIPAVLSPCRSGYSGTRFHQ